MTKSLKMSSIITTPNMFVKHGSTIPTYSWRSSCLKMAVSVSNTTQRQLSSSLLRMSQSPSSGKPYGAIVVGAGPAGIATVGNLLDCGVSPVKWIDSSFNGGRLNAKYREVPSNTKVKLFLDFVNASKSLSTSIDKYTRPNAYATLQGLQQDKGCTLSYASDLCLQLTEGLKSTPAVHASQGLVESATQDQAKRWRVETRTGQSQETKTDTASLLVLCTGSFPTPATLPSTYPNLVPVDLDIALSPSRLSRALPHNDETKIAVIGASHSAILVLRNLYNLASTTHPNLKIVWFSRHALRYAEEKDGWILRDNTGLKGEAAQWARDNLEPAVFEASVVSKHIERVSTSGGSASESQKYKEHLPSCNCIVEAVGFTRAPIPRLWKERKDGDLKSMNDVTPDHRTGGFVFPEGGGKVIGLYGAGIAFPEGVKDPLGNKEMAVGLWKFMKYLKRVVPDWK